MKTNDPRSWVAGALWLTIGTGLARVAPLLLGAAFARQYSPDTYAHFVAFVIAVNLVAAIPLMGSTQLMLSDRERVAAVQLTRAYLSSHALVHALCWGAMVLFNLVLSAWSPSSALDMQALAVLYVYSLGYGITGLVAAAFNRAGRRDRAGASWIVSTVASTAVGLAGIGWHLPAPWVLAGMALGWLVGGLLCLLASLRQPALGAPPAGGSGATTPGAWQVIAFGAPSVVYLLGLYLLTQHARASTDPVLQAAFSLGFQLFSAALFLPGVLGNLVTPRLTQLANAPPARRRFIGRVLGAYLLIAAAWLCLTYWSLPWILVAFRLPANPAVQQLVMVLQGCAAIAAIMALVNQLMAADRLSRHSLGASLVWLLVSLVPWFPGEASLQSALSMATAYGVTLLVGAVAWWWHGKQPAGRST